MSQRLYFYSLISRLIPETRFYSLKAYLLTWCGYSISRSARIVSSVKFVGAFEFSVGNDTFIGHEVLVAGGQCLIFIGKCCDLAPRVCLIAGTHEIDMIGDHTAGKGNSQAIIIEDGVWIGANVTVLGGVRIGKKSVIAAGSTVIHDIPPFTIAAGTPCVVIKEWDADRQCWISIKKE